MINMTAYALELVEKVFEGKKDKGGSPYIQHLIRVSSQVKSKKDKTIALLHDILEDTDITKKNLLDMGFEADVIFGVITLTRVEGEDYKDYIKKIAESKNESIIKIKLADLEDNMNLSRISGYTQKDMDRIEKKYKPAHALLNKVLENI